MFTKRPILKIGILAFGITFMVCITIAVSNILISRRPVYVQYNTGVDGRPVNNISVTAVGKINATPDIVTFSAGFEDKDDSFEKLQEDMDSKSQAITKAMKDAGIEDKDITTTQYDIYPDYKYNYNTGEETEDGFRGRITLSIKVRDIEKAGEIIDDAMDAGANTVSNITFTVDDLESVREEARKLAAEAAKKKADTLASSSGVGLGGLIAISEESMDYSPNYYNTYREYETAMGDAVESSPSINPGTLEITITVSATYGIQ